MEKTNKLFFVEEREMSVATGRFARIVEKLPHRVGYFSDCEGNVDVWNRYLAISQVLLVDPHQKPFEPLPVLDSRSRSECKELINSTHFATQRLLLRDHCHFVFGGDVCDRGLGDIRILKALISLKERYPDRVHFILGNRDVNKLRLPTMLHEKSLAEPARAYWAKSPEHDVRHFL